MKYKTTIKIFTDAANKDEAADIAGEYLSGNISTGVRMTCVTRKQMDAKKCVACASVIMFVFVGIAAFGINAIKAPSGQGASVAGISAVQPPLKTATPKDKSGKFKEEWQDRQIKESLDKIKQ